MAQLTRRDFLGIAGAATTAAVTGVHPFAQGAPLAGGKMRFGLVTYMWGADWDLPTLIANCEKTQVLGIELRVEHAHAVEPEISKEARLAVRKRFEDSPVVCVGMGCNEQFDSPDPAEVEKNIARSREYIQLSHDIGGTGVKVKPNRFHDSVPQEKTLEQIGKSLKKLGEYGADLGQRIRLEVHGSGTQELPNIKTIMDHADHPNVGVCWNCNDQDLNAPGLEYNFNLVKDRFADTVHVRELNIGEYPYQQLIDLFVGMDYEGWILLEARTQPEDRVAALAEQLAVFNQMVANAQKA
jgi:sugar phosphate isomerase/epimerase